MRKLPHILLLFLLLSACTSKSQYDAMRRGLDSLNERNRSDQPFTAADVQPYVDFFDSHGTSNDQLLAYYLLGRSYHEQGEAPMALKYYQQAIECADTTSSDCDYAQLCRVYAQIGNVFYYQGLYRQELVVDNLSEYYAWKGKDTLAALLNYEKRIHAYRKLNMSDSVIQISYTSNKLYTQYGYPDYAAVVLSYPISTLIETGKMSEAKKNMDIYESKSGFFDSLGNIVHGREIYYKVKGYYYLGIEKFDSAEYFFRKELRCGKDFNNQNAGAKGLADLFLILHKSDSAAKYYQYAYAMNDSLFAHTATETVERMHAINDYSRHQEIAYQERENATQRTIIIWVCLGLLVIILLIAYHVNRELAHKEHESEQKYLQSLSIIEQARQDIAKLYHSEESNKILISEKEQIIREQEIILKSLLHHSLNSQSLAEKKLKESSIYKRIDYLSTIGQKPTDKEWKQIEEIIYVFYPGFGDYMKEKSSILTEKEYKTCLMVRIGIKPTNIGNMLGVASSYVTELRAKLTKKLFGVSGNSKSFDHMLKEIY